MVITEEELREAWRNGKGRLPDLPADARLTPAAADFLSSRGLKPAVAGERSLAAVSSQEGVIELTSPPGERLILTSRDIGQFLEGGPVKLIVHPSVTLTDAAKEQLRASGARILPFVEPSPSNPSQPLESEPRPHSRDEELLERVRSAVLSRIDGEVDRAFLDAVIRRVLTELKP